MLTKQAPTLLPSILQFFWDTLNSPHKQYIACEYELSVSGQTSESRNSREAPVAATNSHNVDSKESSRQKSLQINSSNGYASLKIPGEKLQRL